LTPAGQPDESEKESQEKTIKELKGIRNHNNNKLTNTFKA